MKSQFRLPIRLNMPKLVLLGAMLFGMHSSHAVIPPSITNTYPTITGTDNCPTVCTIQNGGTLTISGSGALVTFSGSIFIKPGGKLIIQNGALVKMAGNAKISLSSTTGVTRAHMKVDNGRITNVTGLTSTPWSGIETSGGGVIATYTPQVDLSNNSIIENATIGFRNYLIASPNYSDNQGPVNATTAGGKINATYSTFRNCGLHVSICNSLGNGVPNNITTTTSNINWTGIFQYCNFLQTTGYTPVTPSSMVRLTNCSNITFYSCHFTCTNPSNLPYYPSIGILATNASFFLQAYPYNSNPNARCTLTGFSQAGAYVVNSLQTDRVCVVANTDFDKCKSAVDLSGCLNPYIIGCTYTSNIGYSIALSLNNCTGYKMEGNTLTGTGSNSAGIVVKNSGTVYNEVYRNTVSGSLLGVEPMGVNRDYTGGTGLKILCNSLSNVTNSGIAVFPVGQTLSPQGIANQQYGIITTGGKFPISAIVPAANTFRNNSGIWDFYVAGNTNNLSQLSYRYNPAVLNAKPIYTSLLPANIITSGYANTCPVHNVGAPSSSSFSISTFTTGNADLEAQIQYLEGQSQDDPEVVAALDGLYTKHALLIDQMITYYQYMSYSDTTGNGNSYIDSIAAVYQQIGIGYEYQIYLASVLADKGEYANALDALSAISGSFNITDEEATQITNLIDMFTVRKWLSENHKDWDHMPDYLKELVYNHETDDIMFAGALARALRGEFEGIIYEPSFELPPDETSTISGRFKMPLANNIYPNPTNGQASVNWKGDDALLTVYNIVGVKVLEMNIETGINDLDISRFENGIYIAEISVNGKSMYKQRVVKK